MTTGGGDTTNLQDATAGVTTDTGERSNPRNPLLHAQESDREDDSPEITMQDMWKQLNEQKLETAKLRAESQGLKAQLDVMTTSADDREARTVNRSLFGASHRTPETAAPYRSQPDLTNIGRFRSVGESSELQHIHEQLRLMSSQVHQATSSAPDILRAIEETQKTPFSRRITDVTVRHSAKIKFVGYDGRSDPVQYLTAFTIAMARAQFLPEEKDAGLCQLFVENLSGSALDWFSHLDTGTIDSFQQLSTVFIKHYSMYITKKASTSDLWTLSQLENESLKDFIDRFKAVAARIIINDEGAIAALRKALWYRSRFKDELLINPPQTLEDALHRANRFIEIEEEHAIMAKKQHNTRSARDRDEVPREPRQHHARDHPRDRRGRAAYVITRERKAHRFASTRRRRPKRKLRFPQTTRA